MKTLRDTLAIAVLTASIGIAGPVFSQDGELSEGEITERFNKQIEGLGATRGLTLSNDTGGLVDEELVKESEYKTVEPENQVNLRITFEFDSSAIAHNQQAKLVRMCNAMKNTNISVFRVIGHTDASGSQEYNASLSRLRAEEVMRYLVGDECGIEESRLQAIGVGEEFLFDEGDPDAGVNRRVEFQALS